MGNIVIKVENLGKLYRIGMKEQIHDTLIGAMTSWIRSPFKNFNKLRKLTSLNPEEESEDIIWALRDVSFEVKHGEVLGIIGHNGAGKSTLLKILSRITDPTTGSVTIEGRVASLLEVGTGFHQDLTGRENIYMNGTILGMTKKEIDRKFDEIVDFSVVEKFIDTPIKRYSSGMKVRLAFSVAAHLEPEILIIDEVLAVGDAAFQKKCLGKMQDVATQGRTVLFVSHNMAAVSTLCEESILLGSGRIIMMGKTRDVVAYYLDSSNKMYTPIPFKRPTKNNGEIRLLATEIIQDGTKTNVVNCRRPFSIDIAYEIISIVQNARLFLLFRNEKGEAIFGTSNYDDPTTEALDRKVGSFISTITIPGNLLKTGTIYGTVGADVQADRIIFAEDDILEIHVVETGGDIVSDRHQRVGVVAPLLQWRITPVKSESEYLGAD